MPKAKIVQARHLQEHPKPHVVCLHDLGLGQLFFPDLELDSDSTCHETEQEMEEEGKGKGKWREDGEVPGYQVVAAEAATREGVKEVGIEVELGSLRIGETEVVS